MLIHVKGELKQESKTVLVAVMVSLIFSLEQNAVKWHKLNNNNCLRCVIIFVWFFFSIDESL